MHDGCMDVQALNLQPRDNAEIVVLEVVIENYGCMIPERPASIFRTTKRKMKAGRRVGVPAGYVF